MAIVAYNFNNASTLQGMDPPALPGGAFGNATLPVGLAGAGIYIIVNTITNNRYCGISTNLATRFGPRMACVTELGFHGQTLAFIALFWGTVSYCDTVNQPLGVMSPVLNYGAPLDQTIDGVNIQLERLLIRYVLTQMGAGGTVSNNMLAMNPYVNPGPNPIQVRFSSAQAGNLFNPFNHVANWPVGGVGW